MDPSLLANLIYLALMATIWLIALALVTPGTGILELLALGGLAVTVVGFLNLNVNVWALPVLAFGAIFFGMSIWRWQRGIWLALSAICLSLGSVIMFQVPDQSLSVHPVLAIGVSLLTLAYFWLTVRKSLLAYRAPRHDSLADILGKIGEVRTPLDPIGSVYVQGELWSARAEKLVPVGAKVQVTGREGLVLLVQPVTRHRAA
jgi:membrane-bound serine protease (ClpP class)